MKEKWCNGRVFGKLLTDIPKPFGCLSHELLIVKLYFNCCGSDKKNFRVST